MVRYLYATSCSWLLFLVWNAGKFNWLGSHLTACEKLGQEDVFLSSVHADDLFKMWCLSVTTFEHSCKFAEVNYSEISGMIIIWEATHYHTVILLCILKDTYFVLLNDWSILIISIHTWKYSVTHAMHSDISYQYKWKYATTSNVIFHANFCHISRKLRYSISISEQYHLIVVHCFNIVGIYYGYRQHHAEAPSKLQNDLKISQL